MIEEKRTFRQKADNEHDYSLSQDEPLLEKPFTDPPIRRPADTFFRPPYETTECTDFTDYEEEGTRVAGILIDFPGRILRLHCQAPWIRASVKSVVSFPFRVRRGGDLGTARPMAAIYGEIPIVEASFLTWCTDSTFALSRTNATRTAAGTVAKAGSP